MKLQRILFSTEHYGGLPLLHSDAKRLFIRGNSNRQSRCPALFKGLPLLAFSGSSYPQWCAVRKSQAESFRGQYWIDFKFFVAWWSICPLYPYDWHVVILVCSASTEDTAPTRESLLKGDDTPEDHFSLMLHPNAFIHTTSFLLMAVMLSQMLTGTAPLVKNWFWESETDITFT